MTAAPAQFVKSTDGRVGQAPLSAIFCIENHDEAFAIWRDSGVRGRILVHIDAHHDMWWLRDRARMDIADFICPALQDGLVREVYWVVPDRSWQGARNRRHVLRMAREILKGYPGETGLRVVARNRISAKVNGKPLEICALDSLPLLREKVLLDIDTDYFLIPCVTYGERDEPAPLPWCWPDDLVRRLQVREVTTDLVTIAYSVEGGYTPLRWKYLGDELALRLQHSEAGHSDFAGMALLRKGAEAMQGGKLADAEKDFREAQERLPTSAAPSLNLSLLCYRKGPLEEARNCHSRATELDPSYRTPFSTTGLWEYWKKHFSQAQAEFGRAAALDPSDATAQLGLGWLALQKKNWKEAEGYLRRATELDKNSLDAWRELGRSFAKQHADAEAIAAYENSLRLALAGRRALNAGIATAPPAQRLEDPFHWETYKKLGKLYQRTRNFEQAIARFRMSAGASDGVDIRLRIALLQATRREWSAAARELGRAMQQIPRAIWSSLRRVTRPVGEFVEQAYEYCRVL